MSSFAAIASTLERIICLTSVFPKFTIPSRILCSSGEVLSSRVKAIAFSKSSVETSICRFLAYLRITSVPFTKKFFNHEKGGSLPIKFNGRSEEHTSELQSRPHLVCRLLLEKKKTS